MTQPLLGWAPQPLQAKLNLNTGAKQPFCEALSADRSVKSPWPSVTPSTRSHWCTGTVCSHAPERWTGGCQHTRPCLTEPGISGDIGAAFSPSVGMKKSWRSQKDCCSRRELVLRAIGLRNLSYVESKLHRTSYIESKLLQTSPYTKHTTQTLLSGGQPDSTGNRNCLHLPACWHPKHLHHTGERWGSPSPCCQLCPIVCSMTDTSHLRASCCRKTCPVCRETNRDCHHGTNLQER